jgi:hypothetical protein
MFSDIKEECDRTVKKFGRKERMNFRLSSKRPLLHLKLRRGRTLKLKLPRLLRKLTESMCLEIM